MSDVENVIIVGSGPAGYTAALYTARANLQPAGDRGLRLGRPAPADDRRRELPRLPRRRDGPGDDAEVPRPGRALRRAAVTDQADRVELASEPGGVHSVWVGDDRAPRAHGRAGDGRRAQEAGRRRRGGALRPRRQLLRHLRRRLLPRRADDHRRRRRLGDGGGDLPVEVRRQGHRRAPPRRVPRLEDHARARARAVEHRVPHALHRQASSSPARTARSATPRCVNAETGEEREIPVSGTFIAVGHEPQSALVRGQIDVDENGYVVTEGSSTRTNRPGVFAAGDLVDHTYRQAITAAGSGCQAALDAEWYLRDTPGDPDPAGHAARRPRRSAVGACGRSRARVVGENATRRTRRERAARRAQRVRTS